LTASMKLPYRIGWLLFNALARGFYDYRVVGRERLAEVPGGALLVCNHASFFDPPLVGLAFDEEIHYLARKSLMSNRLAGVVYDAWNSIPVDQDKPDMSGLRTVIRTLKKGGKVLIFPEGSRTEDGALLPGEPGTGLIVAKAGVPVIPMRLFGTREALPRHAAFPRPSQITLVIGEPWHYDPAKYQAEGKDLYKAISDELMMRIAEISL
jgi:1-acyl-sn-glycerol-3-phosphate acyltransferase